MTTETLLRLFNEADGTFRITPNGYEVVSYTDGYQVGGYVPTLIDPSSIVVLRDWFTRGHEETFGLSIPDAGLCIGLWTDSEGRRHWDASTRWVPLPGALEAGRRNGEQCVWDWANGTTIPCNED